MTMWLVPAFALTALLYAMVGFGGGSTYAALLVITGTDYRFLPLVVLACNIMVATGGVWRYARSGHLKIRPLLPLLALSAPAAWIGGRLPVSEMFFVCLLAIALLFSGVALLLGRSSRPVAADAGSRRAVLTGGASTACGFTAGLTGIGGGIFLAPVLHLTGWGTAREISAASSLFIVINSLAGLAGHLMKGSAAFIGEAVAYGWPLALAVLGGGFAGSLIGAHGLDERIIRKLTGLLILAVSFRLFFRVAGRVL